MRVTVPVIHPSAPLITVTVPVVHPSAAPVSIAVQVEQPSAAGASVTPARPAGASGETAAEHLRNAMQLLLETERGRAIATVENGEEVIRLGMALLPDATFRAIGERLLAVLELLEQPS